VLDFIKNIANVLIKGALVGLGTYGLSKLFDSEEVRKTLKDFIKNMFFSILNVIQKSARMLNEVMTENAPQIREAVVSTFLAIKDLLVTSIKGIGDLLSDKRIWEGVWEIISTIFNSIKKVLSTEVEIEGVKVSLGTVLGAVIVAFGALKGAVFLLKAAAESAAKSLFGVGGAEVPDVDKSKKKGPSRGSKLLGGSGVVGATVGAGAALSYGAASTLESMSKEELDILAQSGGGDDTAMAAAILSQSKTPTPAPKRSPLSPSQVSSGQTTPLTMEQTSAAVSETKKFLGKNAADFIIAKEGFAEKAYLDPPGNNKNQYSIGHGHLIQPHEVKQGYITLSDGKKVLVKGPGGKDTTITKEEARLLLNSDLPKYEKAAADPLGPEAWSKLNEDQRTALISYAYNAGSTASLVKAGLRDAILRGNMEEAANIIYQRGAKTSGGKYLAGLERRRLSESTLFASGRFEAPTQMASAPSPVLNTPVSTEIGATKPSPMDSIASLAHEQFLALDKLMGGKLMQGSTELADMLRDITKEFMNNPTFVDNSQIVNNNNSQAQSGPIASAYNQDATNLLVGRVTSSYYGG
jgi:GH24 family phage-related lysozyme (muramidase)